MTTLTLAPSPERCSSIDGLADAPPNLAPHISDLNSSFESASVAAILAQRSREDQAALLDELVSMLSDIVPGVRVERALLRRHITALHVPLGGFVYVLKRSTGNAYEASRQHHVRGIAIRTDPMEIDVFLAELGPALDAELRRTERGRDALREWLNSS